MGNFRAAQSREKQTTSNFIEIMDNEKRKTKMFIKTLTSQSTKQISRFHTNQNYTNLQCSNWPKFEFPHNHKRYAARKPFASTKNWVWSMFINRIHSNFFLNSIYCHRHHISWWISKLLAFFFFASCIEIYLRFLCRKQLNTYSMFKSRQNCSVFPLTNTL